MRLNDDNAVSKAIAMFALDHLRHADASPAKGNATPSHGAQSAGWRCFPRRSRETAGDNAGPPSPATTQSEITNTHGRRLRRPKTDTASIGSSTTAQSRRARNTKQARYRQRQGDRDKARRQLTGLMRLPSAVIREIDSAHKTGA